MITYSGFLLTFLCMAGIFNLYQPRALTLVLIVTLFLVLIPQLLPDPDLFTWEWFLIPLSLELSLAFFALSTQTRPGIAVAAFSLVNSLLHFVMAIVYIYIDQYYDIAQIIYQNLIRIGEISQIIALSLYSRPIIRLAVWWITRHKENDDGSHQFISHRG